jgi:deoxyribonuclease IV
MNNQIGYTVTNINDLAKFDNTYTHQIYITDPTKANTKLIHQIDELKKARCNMVVHGKFIYNPCNELLLWQLDALKYEIQISDILNADLIIHQGKNINKLDDMEAMNIYCEFIKSVLDLTIDCNNRILLENSARQGTELGYNIDDLSYIYNYFDEYYQKRLGICIDTCHLFVSGAVNLRKYDETERFFNEFNKKIGINAIKVIHFNDSNADFDTRNDNHGAFSLGHITKNTKTKNGMTYIRDLAFNRGIPLILETPTNILSINKQIEFIDRCLGQDLVLTCKDDARAQ